MNLSLKEIARVIKVRTTKTVSKGAPYSKVSLNPNILKDSKLLIEIDKFSRNTRAIYPKLVENLRFFFSIRFEAHLSNFH